MALLEWQDEYRVGIEMLDHQHKKILQLINNFYDMMRLCQDNEEMPRLLGELAEYGNAHLALEEKYFEQYDYPDKEEHIKAHDFYRSEIEEFVKDTEDTLIPFTIIDFLEDWWINHIIDMDQKYAKFFQEKGLA